MRLKILKYPLSCIAGIIVIILYCTFTFISAGLFPKAWSPMDTWLSDFGNSSFSPNGAIFYNIGCILTGCALFPFFIGLINWEEKIEEQWNKILIYVTIIVGILSAFSLIMIGVFSEDFMSEHIFWSNVFFDLNLGVLILSAITLYKHEDFIKPIAYIALAVAIINFSFVFFGTPILEWFTVFSALGFVGLLVYNMYNEEI